MRILVLACLVYAVNATLPPNVVIEFLHSRGPLTVIFAQQSTFGDDLVSSSAIPVPVAAPGDSAPFAARRSQLQRPHAVRSTVLLTVRM